MNHAGLTLTVIANMTANYGEGLGNISSVQKVFRNGKTYAIRSRESLKNALMVQTGFYDDMQVEVDKKATQKIANQTLNAANCRALDGGYMNTVDNTVIRKSSFYLTDAVACEPFVSETRFHNNLYMASTFAKANHLQVQNDAGKCGLMPYQYEYDKSIKQYSITIDLDKIGVDENFAAEADAEEKTKRVIALLDGIESLQLVVKGNLDNAEPLFVVGGIGSKKTHYFENVVQVRQGALVVSEELRDRVQQNYQAGLLKSGTFSNEAEIENQLHTVSITKFFDQLREQVHAYYAKN